MKKIPILMVVVLLLMAGACVKSTINLDMISDQVSLDPSLKIAAFKGEVTLMDLITPTDTLVVDENNALKVVFGIDSVINYDVSDFYDAFPATNFSKTFVLAAIGSLEGIKDTLILDPGADVRLREISVTTGEVTYTLRSWCNFDATVDILFPTVEKNSLPLVQTVLVPANGSVTGTLNLDQSLMHLDSDPANPFNRIPVEYSIATGTILPPYELFDSVKVEIEFLEPEFDYTRGYFGYHLVDSESDTLDTDMEDLFSKITGSIYLSNPIIRVDYKNSFGMPMRVVAEAIGKNKTEELTLGRDPIDIDYPTSLSNRDISSGFEINSSNSSLPALVSMLPNEIIFFGSATVNPGGDTGEDNLVFGDSRFTANLEIEVPLEFRIADLQLSDTTDNFLRGDNGDESPLDMLSRLRVDMFIDNGFPIGGTMKMELYDVETSGVIGTVETGDFFEPADVDLSGRVTSSVEHTSFLELTQDFIDAVPDAENIIFTFTLFTTDHGTRDVKIYTDYGIAFKAALSFKAEINSLNN